jgi:Arc/MetJ family transcription regulator
MRAKRATVLATIEREKERAHQEEVGAQLDNDLRDSTMVFTSIKYATFFGKQN